MAADLQHTRPAVDAGKPIPIDVACCRRCGGSIYFVDATVDTLDEQVKRWLCCDCVATGSIRLTMTLDEAPPYYPAPTFAGIHHRARKGGS
jgi:hypothetical protein